jgi:hypothetical protein
MNLLPNEGLTIEKFEKNNFSEVKVGFIRQENLKSTDQKKQSDIEKEKLWKKQRVSQNNNLIFILKKQEKLKEIKEELEKIKKESTEVVSIREDFNDAINKLEKFKQETEKESFKKQKKNQTINLDVIKEEAEEDHKSKSNISKQITKNEKIDIKQRMISYKLKIFDKLDIKKVINYWFEKRVYLKNKKSERTIINIKEDFKGGVKEKDEKVIMKGETNVKYEFKKPDNNLLKIIPFCNNIFSIQKSDN